MHLRPTVHCDQPRFAVYDGSTTVRVAMYARPAATYRGKRSPPRLTHSGTMAPALSDASQFEQTPRRARFHRVVYLPMNAKDEEAQLNPST